MSTTTMNSEFKPMDIEPETGKDAPHFWYNKEVLDRYGIEY